MGDLKKFVKKIIREELEVIKQDMWSRMMEVVQNLRLRDGDQITLGT